MQRKSFTQRILMPPILIFAIVFVAIMVSKVDNFIIKRTGILIVIACLMLSPSISSLLCFYQGGSRVERILVGFLPLLAWMFYQISLSIMNFITTPHFGWRYVTAIFHERWMLIWFGLAFLQLSLVEIWVIRKLKQR